MASSPSLSHSRFSDDQMTWDSLKRAISASSGFQSWRMEKVDRAQSPELSHDELVLSYLRETLDTLAY
ncbi:MAG: hypothetical protein ACFE0J_04185 [Elainellaceae cyanobacterium]